MTTTTRDPWADAAMVATHEVLDDDVAAVRRRAWLRRALPWAAGGVVLVIALMVFDAFLGLDAAARAWNLPPALRRAGLGLVAVGLLLVAGSGLRLHRSEVKLPFVGPTDLLPRTERAWVRAEIKDGRPVPDDRRTVVVSAARRLSAEGLDLSQPGKACLFVGMAAALALPGPLVFFVALAAWTVVTAVHAQLWARRARRWLAQHA